VMLIMMSFLRIGNLVHYIPRSVTIGFTTGIAVIIFSGQISNFFGLSNVEKKEYFHENMLEIFRHFPTMNFYSIITAIIGIITILVIPRLSRKIPVYL